VSESRPALSAPPEMPVELECGHRILLRWGADPAVGAPVAVRHRNECADPGRPPTERWAAAGPWAVRRLGPAR
jgi:hypothetical protein